MNRKSHSRATLGIHDVRHLCMRLGISERGLSRLCENAEDLYACWPVERNGKIRPIASPKPSLKPILVRLNDILQRLDHPSNIHGGIRGRSTLSYVSGHIKRPVLLKVDIENFFPSVRSGRVYRLFRSELDCSPSVARYLTRLTTFQGSLPQGSPTSTIVAALISRRLAARLEQLGSTIQGRADLFVDDGVLSGPGYVGRFENTVKRMVSQEGFRAHPTKTKPVPASEEQVLTGIKVNRRVDVPSEKVQAVIKLIDGIRIRIASGSKIPARELNSIRGKIMSIRTLSTQKGNSLLQRLDVALRPPSQVRKK